MKVRIRAREMTALFAAKPTQKTRELFASLSASWGEGNLRFPETPRASHSSFYRIEGFEGSLELGPPLCRETPASRTENVFFFSPGAKTFINGFIFCINIYILYRCIFYDIFVTENKEFYINYDTVMNNMPLIYHFMYISFYIYI